MAYNPNNNIEIDPVSIDSTNPNSQLPEGAYFDEIYAQSHPGYLYTDKYGSVMMSGQYGDTHPGKNHGSPQYTSIQSQAVSSTAYQRAYDLFSASPFQSDMWLQRLEALVLSLQMPTYNPWDISGVQYENTMRASLEQFYINVNSLISEYQQWFNSLPAEQRSQFSSSGINIALDGGSAITGSSVPSSSQQSSGFGDLSNAATDNALNYVSAVSGGFLSFISAFNSVFSTVSSFVNSRAQITTQRETNQDSLNLQRQQLGLQPISLGKSTDPYVVEQDNYTGPIRSSAAKNDLDYFTYSNDAFPERQLQAAIVGEQSDVFQEIYGEIGNIRLQNMYLDVLLQNEIKSYGIKQAQLDTKKAETNLENFDTLGSDLIVSEMSSQVSSFKESKSLSDLRKKVSDYKRKVIDDWISKANDNSNPNRWMYQTMLMKLSPSLNEYGNPADVTFDYGEQSTEIITKWLNTISDFTPKPKAKIKK